MHDVKQLNACPINVHALAANLFLLTERYYLIFWPEEDAITAVPEAKVVDPSHPEAGMICRVKMGKNT